MVHKCWFTLRIEILVNFYNILVNYGQNQEIFQEKCNFLEEISWSLISCFLVFYQEMCNSKYEPAFIKIYSFFSGVKKIMRILPDSFMGNSPGFQDPLYTPITRIMVSIITKGLPLLNRLSNHSNSLIHITPLWECEMPLMMTTLPPDKMMKR